MKNKKYAMLLVLLFMTSGPVAFAATTPATNEFDVSIGMGSGPDIFDSGPGFNIGAGTMLNSITDNLQGRADLGYYKFDRDFRGTSFDLVRIPVAVGARYYIPLGDRFRAFGQASVEVSFDDVETPGFFGVKESKSEVNVGVTPAAGIDFSLNPTMSVFALAAGHLVSDSYTTVQIGAAYHF